MTYEKLKERRVLMEDNKLIIYKNSEGNIIVDAIYKDETLWLSQKGMSKVFECSTDNISLHLKHIFEEKELDKKSVTLYPSSFNLLYIILGEIPNKVL